MSREEAIAIRTEQLHGRPVEAQKLREAIELLSQPTGLPLPQHNGRTREQRRAMREALARAAAA